MGEIVAYRNAQLGGHTVLHRIISDQRRALTRSRATTTASWYSFHPDQSELVGTSSGFQHPAAGRYLLSVARPAHLPRSPGSFALLLNREAPAFSHRDAPRARRRRGRGPGAGPSDVASVGAIGHAADRLRLSPWRAFAGLVTPQLDPAGHRRVRPGTRPLHAERPASAMTRTVQNGKAVYGGNFGFDRPTISSGSFARRTSTSRIGSTRRRPTPLPAASGCSQTSLRRTAGSARSISRAHRRSPATV